jgi:triosephosphate isomerase
MRRKIVAGNWKMNKDLKDGAALIEEILNLDVPTDVLKIFAPSFVHLSTAGGLLKGKNDFALSAQDCHQNENGAYTGEVSAAMVRSTGATFVIIGHSERRLYFNENNSLLAQKVNVALSNDLSPIFCIGESMEERNSNRHLEAVKTQLREGLFHLSPSEFAKVVIAYEPVWAIGTGLTATSHQAQGMHNFIRSEINRKYGHEVSENVSILYGGSCNPQNAAELFACIDVDGGLIGGASLKAADFVSICKSF